MCGQYNTGDILVVLIKPIGGFEHFAIVFTYNGIQYVAHNSFTSGKVIITPLHQFVTNRTVMRTIPSNGTATDGEIFNTAIQANRDGKTYDFFGYNCEDFVREACKCNIGLDQRAEFSAIAMFLFAVTIILLLIFD